MNSFRPWLLLLALICAAGGSLRGSDDVETPKSSVNEFVFSLAPKSLQKHPLVNFNALTEMTAAGRKVTRPTADKPAYFSAHSGGYLRLGEAAGGEHPPMPPQLEAAMQKSLTNNHYLAAQLPEHPPSLLIIYYWGSYSMNGIDGQEISDQARAEEENPGVIQPLLLEERSAEELLPRVLADRRKWREVLERASLVGGERFASELNRVMEEETQIAAFDVSASRVAAIMGNASTEFASALRPFNRFRNRDRDTSRMIDEIFSSCYFVVVSAFDYTSAAASSKKLLWRTKMTVNSYGVSMLDTLPPMIANGGDFFGRDMKKPVSRSQRIETGGRVDVGVPRVVDDSTEPAAPAKEEQKP